MSEPQTTDPLEVPHRSVETFSLPISSLVETDDLRLDASHFNPAVIQAVQHLRESGMRVVRLADVTTRVFIPPRFRRVYVDASVGIPFLQGSHVVHFQPADIKYLSRTAHHRLDRWIIHAGWILVTCSGTIGRVTICPEEWDGWAASQHILRIVPNEEMCPSGYLSSFLSSSFGQVQLTANIYGAVVDELTEQQAESVLVPLPETSRDWELVKSIDQEAKNAIARKSDAVALAKSAVEGFMRRIDSKIVQMHEE